MDEHPEGLAQDQVPEPEDNRFVLLRWWDQLTRSWRERRASRPVPITPSYSEIVRWVTLLGRPDDPSHAQALDELVVMGRPAVPTLIEALQSETWIQAFRATEALGLIGDRRAVGPLVRLLNHPNSNVRWGAAEALGRIQSRRGRGTLRRLAQEDDNRTSWGETVAEASERALASIDRTWISQLLNLVQILFYLALCAAVVFAAFWFIRDRWEHRPVVTPTSEPTTTPTPAPSATPTVTPLPVFEPIPAVVVGNRANVRDQPASDTLIGVLHSGDEILIYGGRIDDQGAWWYLVRLIKVNNPATDSALLIGGTYGWVFGDLVSGVESPDVAPTVAAVETIRAGAATPTPLGSSQEMPTPGPTSVITTTATPSP
jgi:hypothetical protein